jgi:hypothetical protein
MEYKEYKISEIVDMIGVSKATVYNKIGSLKDILRNHINVRKGIKYIDSEGFSIIQDSIGFSKVQYTDLKEEFKIEQENINNSIVSNKIETLENNSKLIESLETQLEYLKSVIAEKDRQLETRDSQISGMTKLVENSQVLLRQQQDKIFLLESPQDKPVKEKKSIWYIFRKG